MTDLDALCRIAVGEAKPGEELEAFAEWGRKTDVRVYESKVEELSAAEAQGVGIRIVSEGRIGYAYSADPSPDEVREIVAQARQNAMLGTADEGNVLPDPLPIEPLHGIFNDKILRASPNQKVAIALELERACLAADPRIKAVESAEYGEAISRVAIRSTRGVQAQSERGDCWAVVSAIATQGDETQTGFSFELGRALDELDVQRCASDGAMRAARLLGAKKPKTARMAVLLEPFAATSLLGVLSAGLTAESVLKGRSLFAEKQGEQVASDQFTLIDDGRELMGPGAAPFDDEGTPTQRTVLIENGVLKGFLHNAYSAKRMNTRSTGNAGRAGFKSTPGIGPTNLFVHPGTQTPEQLLAKGRTLLVQDLLGVHSGANPISGDFSVGVTGILYDHGVDPQPIREAAISSTILDILRSITQVGNDLRFFGGTGSPSILIGEMTVAGS